MKRQNLINYLKSVIYKNDNNEIDAEKHQSLETQILNDVAVIEDDFISDPAAATPRNTFNAVFVKQQLNNLAGGFKNRQNPVTNVADLATTYPNATSDGWAAMVTSVGYIYAYNESGNWVNTGLTAFPEDVATQEDIDAAIDAEVISRNAELAKKQNKAIVFSQLNADPDITLATEGDKAWNNTYNKIYTAILVNSALTWANPVNAEYGVMYIYGTQNYQLKDGLMVVVGDNTGGGGTATVNGDSVNTAIENDYTPQTGQIGDTNKFVSIGKKTISALIVWNYIKSKLLNVAIDLNSGTTIGAKKPVTSINNIEADTNGNIEITGGGAIDDNTTSTDKTWSSEKIAGDLSDKVDKNGTDRLMTEAEGNKLAGINEHWRGSYQTLTALKTAVPVANPGDEATIDAGVGTQAQKAIWDETDQDWYISSGTPITVDQSINEGSSNAVSGGSVFSALLNKLTATKAAIEALLTGEISTHTHANLYANKTKGESDEITLVCSRMTEDITASSTIPKAYHRFTSNRTFSDVVGSLVLPAVGGNFTVDIHKNGTSIFSTRLTFDSAEGTTRTATIPYVLTSSPLSFVDGDYVEVFADYVGSDVAGQGLEVTLLLIK